MKVAGFTFIRNAVIYDYPIIESISSVLPLCDEFIVAVGKSSDATLALIESIGDSKVKIIETVWDDSLREGGKVLAQETDKALAAVSSDVDWAFYIQADEVIHEKYLPIVIESMRKHLTNRKVDGLLFNYLHFYGSYRYVGDSRRWYRHEIRVVRPDIGVYAYRDAQGFRKNSNQKLRVKLIDAYIYHYGWVKSIDKIKRKFGYFYRFWLNDEKMEESRKAAETFQFEKHIDSLINFTETHPTVMRNKIQKDAISFYYDTKRKNYSIKLRFLSFVEKLTGWRVGEYRNYKLLR